MRDNSNVKFKIAYLLFVNSGESSLLLGISGLLMSIGSFFVEKTSNYVSMYDLASPVVWGMLFLVYSIIKFYSCFNRTSVYIRTANSVVGIWSWNYVFMSFVIFDVVLPEASDFLIIIPIIAEVWSMLALPQPRNWRKDRRKKPDDV